MKITNTKLTALSAGILLSLGSISAYAVENQVEPPLNKDQINGRVDEIKGSLKESTGKVLDDKGMEIEGNIQKNVGKAQAGYGDLKKEIKDGK